MNSSLPSQQPQKEQQIHKRSTYQQSELKKANKLRNLQAFEHAKQRLFEAVVIPLKFKQLFSQHRKPWKGILLFGPPGAGKKYLAKICAQKAQAVFLHLSILDLISKYGSQSDKIIKNIFNKARNQKPSVLYIDEGDLILKSQWKKQNQYFRILKTEILIQIQGVGRDDTEVAFILAISQPERLQNSILKRLQLKLYIGLPCQKRREQIIKSILSDSNHSLLEADIEDISNKTQFFSGDELFLLFQQAKQLKASSDHQQTTQLKSDEIHQLSKQDFLSVLKNFTPSMNESKTILYEQIGCQFE